MRTVFTRQYKRIDAYRTKIVFLLFFVGLNLTFTSAVMVTFSYPIIFGFIFTENFQKQAQFLYNGMLFWVKICSYATPFLLTFFMLDKVLKFMLSLQTFEQKLTKKLIDYIFRRYYRKHRRDPKIPKQLGFVLRCIASMNTWFLRRKTWQQYLIILCLFISHNPFLLRAVT